MMVRRVELMIQRMIVMWCGLGAGSWTACGAPGLVSVPFHEPDFRRPAAERVEVVVEPVVATGKAHRSFSRVWLGWLELPVARPLRIRAEADDGVVVTVDGRDVIDGWHRPQREGGVDRAEGGRVPVMIRYFQDGGEAVLRLTWSVGGGEFVAVPVSAFSHEPADLEQARGWLEGRVRVPVPAVTARSATRPAAGAVAWSPGPWLMLDEANLLLVEHLTRRVGRPRRHGAPMVDGAVDGNFQPYLTVIRDEATGRWRMWYNVPKTRGNWGESSLALIESEDGVTWRRPHRVLVTPPIQFGASVLDEGVAVGERAKRFKAAWYKSDGLQVAFSADGVTWSELAPGPVLRHSHDINAIDWDPIRGRYMAFVSFGTRLDPSWREARRIPHMSTSSNLVDWARPWPVVTPDPSSPREQGETQFYCMAGVLARGNLLVALVKVLRDDLNTEPGLVAADLGDNRAHAGVGYTVLAWSRDGEHWQRDTEPFLDRNPESGTWDRAHAWADDQVLVGDELRVFYAGYRLGHKGERFTTRQIGLARLPVDRYAGYVAEEGPGGVLRTAVRPWAGRGLTVNAAVHGALRVGVCEPSGKFVPGFALSDHEPIQGDAVAHPVRWKGGDLGALAGRNVQLVFQLKSGTIYAFTVTP